LRDAALEAHEYDRQMDVRALGGSGVAVSRLVLGCGNFGGVGSAPALFDRGTSRETAFFLMDRAWELGITTFDTADAYGGGRSESWLGDWLRAREPEVRDRIVIQTKTFNPMDEGHDSGLSRRRILRQIDTSLARLGVDRVALYMAHDFDTGVPQEETLLAFDHLVRSGKVGAVGASNFSGEQLAEALEISELEDLSRYEWIQNSFSLLEQRDRETVFPVCREHGIGYQPFGPLAGGWLAGKYRRDEEPPAGSRMTQRPEPYLRYRSDAVWKALDALRDRAALLGTSMSALALAWLLHVPEVTCVVIGPNRPEHLADVEEAQAIRLTPRDHAEIGDLFL
jgi:aryl-alcohol dehydrogenase-like predicted oxidoreductase